MVSPAQCSNEMKQNLQAWKEHPEVTKKLLTLLNSYSPPELRNICIGKGPVGIFFFNQMFS
jgi:ubiquitin carboxyl-terminal hydrolase 34